MKLQHCEAGSDGFSVFLFRKWWLREGSCLASGPVVKDRARVGTQWLLHGLTLHGRVGFTRTYCFLSTVVRWWALHKVSVQLMGSTFFASMKGSLAVYSLDALLTFFLLLPRRR